MKWLEMGYEVSGWRNHPAATCRGGDHIASKAAIGMDFMPPSLFCQKKD